MKRSRIPVLSLALVACDGILGGGDCTLIGCFSGLTVQVATPPAGAYRVEVRSNAPGGVYVVECTPTSCQGGAFFPDFTPSQAEVSIVSATGTIKRSVQPTYSRVFPNGEDCGGACTQGTVRVDGTS